MLEAQIQARIARLKAIANGQQPQPLPKTELIDDVFGSAQLPAPLPA